MGGNHRYPHTTGGYEIDLMVSPSKSSLCVTPQKF
jgi:hypothetical protein